MNTSYYTIFPEEKESFLPSVVGIWMFPF